MVGLVPSIHVLRRNRQPPASETPLARSFRRQDVDGRHKGDHDGRGKLIPATQTSRMIPSPITHTGRPSGGMPEAGRRLRAGVTPRSREASGTAESRRLRRRLPTLRSQTAQACLRGALRPLCEELARLRRPQSRRDRSAARSFQIAEAGSQACAGCVDLPARATGRADGDHPRRFLSLSEADATQRASRRSASPV
jgi:hypothetical protein